MQESAQRLTCLLGKGIVRAGYESNEWFDVLLSDVRGDDESYCSTSQWAGL